MATPPPPGNYVKKGLKLSEKKLDERTKVEDRTKVDGSPKAYGMMLYQNDQKQRDQTQLK